MCCSGTPVLCRSNRSLAEALWVNFLWRFATEERWADLCVGANPGFRWFWQELPCLAAREVCERDGDAAALVDLARQ